MRKLTLAPFLLLLACGDNIEPPDAPALLANGEACEAGAEACESGLCLEALENGVEIAEGMCTDECMWNEDNTDTCVTGEELCLRYNPTEEFYCFQTCQTDNECRTGDGWACSCLDFFCISKACLPPF